MSSSYPSTSLTGNSLYTFLLSSLWCEYPVSPSPDLKSKSSPVHSLSFSAILSNPSSILNTPSNARDCGLHMSLWGSTCSLMKSLDPSSSRICAVIPSTNSSNLQSSLFLHPYHSRSGWSDPRCAWILSNQELYRRVPGWRTTVKYLYSPEVSIWAASPKVEYCDRAKCESPPLSWMYFSTSGNEWMPALRPVMYVVSVLLAAFGTLQYARWCPGESNTRSPARPSAAPSCPSAARCALASAAETGARWWRAWWWWGLPRSARGVAPTRDAAARPRTPHREAIPTSARPGVGVTPPEEMAGAVDAAASPTWSSGSSSWEPRVALAFIVKKRAPRAKPRSRPSNAPSAGEDWVSRAREGRLISRRRTMVFFSTRTTTRPEEVRRSGVLFCFTQGNRVFKTQIYILYMGH